MLSVASIQIHDYFSVYLQFLIVSRYSIVRIKSFIRSCGLQVFTFLKMQLMKSKNLIDLFYTQSHQKLSMYFNVNDSTGAQTST